MVFQTKTKLKHRLKTWTKNSIFVDQGIKFNNNFHSWYKHFRFVATISMATRSYKAKMYLELWNKVC